jgi:hypothetical protein
MFAIVVLREDDGWWIGFQVENHQTKHTSHFSKTTFEEVPPSHTTTEQKE